MRGTRKPGFAGNAREVISATLSLPFFTFFGSPILHYSRLEPIFIDMDGVSKISAFMYFDYIEYLKDLLSGLQSEGGCSMRGIQAKLGMKGSAFFTRILDGSRPLSLENAKILANSLKMDDSEADYFLNLVRFGNEKNVDKREVLLRKLLAARSQKQDFALKDSALKFFDKWYIPVIRDLLPLLPKGANTPDLAAKIGRMMVPTLKGNQVQGAIDYLQQNGFIRIDDEGNFQVDEAIVSTPPRVRSTILRKYHLKNLEINSQAYDELTSDDRSISSVTCSLSKESFEKVRLEIQQFRERVLAIAREDKNPDRVSHLGLQFVVRAKAPKNTEGHQGEEE